MDFSTYLPFSQGFTCIFIVVDRLSKAIHFGALTTSYTASKVAQLFRDIVASTMAFPNSLSVTWMWFYYLSFGRSHSNSMAPPQRCPHHTTPKLMANLRQLASAQNNTSGVLCLKNLISGTNFLVQLNGSKILPIIQQYDKEAKSQSTQLDLQRKIEKERRRTIGK